MDEKILYKPSKSPILPPISEVQPYCIESPDEATVLRAFGRKDLFEVAVRCEKVVDVVDPPRFYPLIGPAQLHHLHWKCEISFTERAGISPQRRTEVMLIDRDHLHIFPAKAPAGSADFPEVRPTSASTSSPAPATGKAPKTMPIDPSAPAPSESQSSGSNKPNKRTPEPLFQPDDLRQIRAEWERFWDVGQPSR
jgi:hypothetical protein